MTDIRIDTDPAASWILQRHVTPIKGLIVRSLANIAVFIGVGVRGRALAAEPMVLQIHEMDQLCEKWLASRGQVVLPAAVHADLVSRANLYRML